MKGFTLAGTKHGHSLVSTEHIPYDILNNLSSVDLFYEEKGKRETSSKKILGVYRAEWLIATKQDADETKYLVKWEGYSSFENTWEPEEHLSPLLLRYFASPKPELAIIQENVDRLRHGILECLRHKGDFSKCQIPNQWHCVFDKHGDGYRM
ncbi:PREDICTED: uncharacterized protein LOC107348994 [Acropora digitifera]|uniref:uncharacterized protein LOC107348994 n=1 Tax=Acropora digitifera TaxID=70779 RepID=UPI00077A4159|nr:PREDICTED: uncharacterized protein LOC107348994 [Acropora digitifera]